MIQKNQKSTFDYTALAIFFPAVIALAIIPTLMRVTLIASDSTLLNRLFHGSQSETEGVYYYIDAFSQVKAFAVAIAAIAMLVVALFCCVYLFRRAEKISLVYVGASVLYVAMTLASAIGSKYGEFAFNGMYDRAEGFFTIACYFVMFLFTMFAFKKSQNFSFIVLALMICTGVNFVIGLFQYFGNDLLNYEWFKDIVIDAKYRDTIGMNEVILTEKQKMYGALYHYNYMGSFAGMIVPLFTVLAFTSRKLVYRIITAVFALISIFMLLAGEARSGFVAVAAAAVVGIIVFARVLIRRWKITVSVVAAAVVAVVGVNIATDNALFARVPTLVEDIAALFVPAEQTDMLAELPVREVTHNKDGSVSFTSQTDVLTISFDAENHEYVFTDSAGEVVPTAESQYGIVMADEDFKGINFEFAATSDELEYNDGIFMWFDGRDDQALLFRLFNEKQIHMIDLETGERVTPINAEAIGFKGKEKLGSSRGYIWSRTIPLLDECMITGYGPDTFALIFPQNDYLAKYSAYGEGFYITVDKPHNLYLQIFFSSGLIALIAFLAICVFYIVDCFRLYALKKSYRQEQYFGIAVMLAIIGYLAAGMFNDSVVSVAPVFWILLGTGAALNTINRRADKGECAEPAAEKPKPAAQKEIQKEQELNDKAQQLVEKLRAERTPAPAPKPAERELSQAEKLAMMKLAFEKVQEKHGKMTKPMPTDEQLIAMMDIALRKPNGAGNAKPSGGEMPENSDTLQDKTAADESADNSQTD